MFTLQYTELTGPVQLERSEEFQSSDRWAPRFADRVPRRMQTIEFPLAVAPVYVPDVTVSVEGLAWMGPLPRDRGPYRWAVVPSGTVGMRIDTDA